MKIDKSKLKIRLAKKEDIETIVEFHKELANYHHKLDPRFWARANEPFSKSFKKNILEKNIGKKNSRILVIEYDKKPIGYFSASIAKTTPAVVIKRMGHVNDGFVDKQFRGQGIGRLVMADILTWFKNNGISVVEGSVSAENKLSLNTWKKMGFKESAYRIRKII